MRLPELDRLRTWHRHRVLALAVAIGLSWLAIAWCVATGWWSGVAFAVALVATFIAVVAPESATAALVVAVSWQWLSSAPPQWSVVPIAVLLLVVHTSAALTGAGPYEAPLPRAAVLLSARRCAIIAAATLVVGVLALNSSTPSLPLMSYAAATVLLLLAVGVLLVTRSFRARDQT